METPKEKAEKLFVKYYEALPQWVNTDDAKKCAIIAVDELISNQMSLRLFYDKIELIENVNFLQKVKSEIEKI